VQCRLTDLGPGIAPTLVGNRCQIEPELELVRIAADPIKLGAHEFNLVAEGRHVAGHQDPIGLRRSP
jgi:hypothetical protein